MNLILPPSSRPRRQLRAALSLLLALAVPACDDEPGLPIACSGPEVCPPPSNSIGWALQVWPASSAGSVSSQQSLAPHEVPQLIFDRTGSAEINLRASVLVEGKVLTAAEQPVVRAHVLAQLPSAILGQSPYTFDTLSTERPAGAWQLRLPVPPRPMEQIYRFWVGFDDPAQASQYPPLWSERAIEGATDVPLHLRAPSELAAVSGRILDPLFEGVGGLIVQVLDGRGQIVSTTAVSLTAQQGLSGSYKVLVDPALSAETPPNLKLVVRPEAQAGLPVLEAPLTALKVGGTLPLELKLPSSRKPLVFQLPVVGLGPSGSLLPVVGARVQAQVVFEEKPLTSGTRAIYTTTADTDADGSARLSLIPAQSGTNLSYTVTVTSPARTPYASTQQEVQVGPSGTGGVLQPGVQLALRAQLTGRLLDAEGEPVPLAQVVAQSIARTDSTGSGPEAKASGSTPPQTTTDQDGRFALRLDSGDYDIDFVPQPGTAPRSSLDNQRLTRYDIDLGDVRLPRLALGKLVITGPGGAPLAQAKLRIFQSPDTSPRFGFACQPGLPCSRVAKLRAEAFTDSKGRAQFLLPDSTPAANLQPPPPLQ